MIRKHVCDNSLDVISISCSVKPSMSILKQKAYKPHRTQWFQHLSTNPKFLNVSDHSMHTSFDIHLAISSIYGNISFQFRFWAHFFAFRNTDTRSKIFPTALKKFALRADYQHISNRYHLRARMFFFLCRSRFTSYECRELF